jgi:hypothetical protein
MRAGGEGAAACRLEQTGAGYPWIVSLAGGTKKFGFLVVAGCLWLSDDAGPIDRPRGRRFARAVRALGLISKASELQPWISSRTLLRLRLPSWDH